MFYLFFCFCLIQRLAELVLSKRNQNFLKADGFSPKEENQALGVMILLHTVWFFGTLVEPLLIPRAQSGEVVYSAAAVFILAQILRVWTMQSLGRHWNIAVWAPEGPSNLKYKDTRVDFVSAGPYKFIRHPNYLVVMVEFLALPMMGGAYFTAAVCSILNIVVLWRRIQLEEKYLFSRIGYRETMGRKARFIPGVI